MCSEAEEGWYEQQAKATPAKRLKPGLLTFDKFLQFFWRKWWAFGCFNLGGKSQYQSFPFLKDCLFLASAALCPYILATNPLLAPHLI